MAFGEHSLHVTLQCSGVQWSAVECSAGVTGIPGLCATLSGARTWGFSGGGGGTGRSAQMLYHCAGSLSSSSRILVWLAYSPVGPLVENCSEALG